MLILTRRILEIIKIGDDIELHVLGISGNQVRIGIDAPREVAVHREEVYRRIHEQIDNSQNSTFVYAEDVARQETKQPNITVKKREKVSA